jgi:multidrug efflux pump subunit AcrB
MQNIDILPKGAMMPLIKPLDIDNDLPIMTIALYPLDETVSLDKLYEKAREFERIIGSVENVSKVIIKGGRKSQYNILVDLHKLSGFHISLAQVVDALESLTTNTPSISAPSVDASSNVLIGIENSLHDVKDIKNLIVANYQGSVIYLKDIATVQKGIDIQNKKVAWISFKTEDGKFSKIYPQTTLEISKTAGTNAVFVTRNLRQLMDSYKESLEKEKIGYKITRDDGDRANDSVNELVFHIVLATLFITILMWLTLGWKEALIVTFTVPLVLALSLICIYFFGMTLNRVTLFGFLLTMGLLVDAGIIVAENIHRHMKQDKEDMKYISIFAVDEIGVPTNIATIAIIFTTLPSLMIGKMMGEFIEPIPIMISIVLIASLFVGYTSVPYFASKYMKKKKGS